MKSKKWDSRIQLVIRVDPAIKRTLRRVSKKAGVSTTEQVRRMLQRSLARAS